MDGMDTGSMSMGSMSMGNGVPSLFYTQHMYWAVVGAAIGLATVVNLLSYVLYIHRLAAARASSPTPAKPKILLTQSYATLTAITRELSSLKLPALSIRRLNLPTPTLGRTALIVANAVTIVVLYFYAGFINICQLPLLFLLAGKNNIIGWLTGVGQEKLNWLHRWVARVFILGVIIHMGYWFSDWAPYDYISTKITTDYITKHGIIAFALLIWIVFTSLTPIRRWSHEIFFLQHIAAVAAFIGMVYLHTPPEVHVWLWICVGLFFFDRILRVLFVMYINLSIFHPRQRKAVSSKGLLSCHASFAPCANGTTRVTIENPPITWKAGQYVFLSCHALAPLQAHPFTIASLPSDGHMDFLIKAEHGGTRKFFRHAEKNGGMPVSQNDISRENHKAVMIEGPYGHIRPLRQFDSVVLFAGSTGATFTMPLLRDIVTAASGPSTDANSFSFLNDSNQGIVTRRIRFVWVIKSGEQCNWFTSQLREAVDNVEALRSMGQNLEVEISIYVTCDDKFTSNPHLFGSRAAPESRHGAVEEVPVDANGEALAKSEKEQGEKGEVRERTNSPKLFENGACGPNGTCCCRTTVEDEDAIKSAVCTCNCHHNNSNYSSDTPPNQPSPSGSTGELVKEPLQHSSISFFGGRPQPRTIIRKMLEQAYGESAVVVCGPQGLVDEVRRSVVSLSDERAVHKGTGAQGIYLHSERFDY